MGAEQLLDIPCFLIVFQTALSGHLQEIPSARPSSILPQTHTLLRPHYDIRSYDHALRSIGRTLACERIVIQDLDTSQTDSAPCC